MTRMVFLAMRRGSICAQRECELSRAADGGASPQEQRLGLYRVRTARQKTGTNISILISPDVSQELLAVYVKNSTLGFIFRSGEGDQPAIAKSYQKYYVIPCFKAAGIHGERFMVSHRLRDTFAVDLLDNGVPLEEVSAVNSGSIPACASMLS